MSIILKSKIVFHEMIFHIDKIWYFVYGCVLSYLTIRSIFLKLEVLIIQKIQTITKSLLVNIKSHLDHKSIAEAICVKV